MIGDSLLVTPIVSPGDEYVQIVVPYNLRYFGLKNDHFLNETQ